MSQSPAFKVAVRGVTRRFGDVLANRSIDLDIADGELLTLLGPSGCGKTTLMRVIAGLEPCDEGRVMIDGREVTRLPARERRLGMVFQSYALFPHLSVAENVAYGLRVQGMTRAAIDARVAEMLDLIRLREFAGRRPQALSGGQQQRVALARAMATRPSLLMLDEPLAALDLKLRRQLQVELKRIHRETGVTILFVTHDQEEALFLSDRIAVMRDGRIEQIDRPDVIYAQPASAFVADFIGDVSLLDCERTLDPRFVRFIDWPDMPPLELPQGQHERRFKLVVRPEHLVIAPAWEPGGQAVVEDIVLEGSTTLLVLRAPRAIVKARLIGRPRLPLAVGSAVAVRIDEEDSFLHRLDHCAGGDGGTGVGIEMAAILFHPPFPFREAHEGESVELGDPGRVLVHRLQLVQRGDDQLGHFAFQCGVCFEGGGQIGHNMKGGATRFL